VTAPTRYIPPARFSVVALNSGTQVLLPCCFRSLRIVSPRANAWEAGFLGRRSPRVLGSRCVQVLISTIFPLAPSCPAAALSVPRFHPPPTTLKGDDTLRFRGLSVRLRSQLPFLVSRTGRVEIIFPAAIFRLWGTVP